MLSPQWLDDLRARVTLSSVVMRTTKLTKAGREWKACCPFHNEKTPSFTVSDEKGGREELAAIERGELAVIEEFLPRQMDEAETKAAIEAIKAELGASGIKDMGRVMAELKARHGTVLDMGKASGWVKESLA